jgi:hypothetical protein
MKIALWSLPIGLALAGGILAFGTAFAGAGRTDCPGKIVCPITGEEVCKDKCPLIDPSRLDCPGKIECPLTGELVCRDRCPLGQDSQPQRDIPSCCKSKK